MVQVTDGYDISDDTLVIFVSVAANYSRLSAINETLSVCA